MDRRTALLSLVLLLPSSGFAQRLIPPYDLWNAQVLAAIKDQATLDSSVVNPSSFLSPYEVYFTSNPSASYFDASAPYAEHDGELITIHGYLAVPPSLLWGSGPFPALVIGHGHHGQGDPSVAQLVALNGFVALAIDGPEAGKSTGGPTDNEQAWISVDEGPQYGYLYHYAYAGMRALTLLEALAARPGNPYRIDAGKLGVFGASMGGIFTTYINAVDDRVKAAIALSSAGNWHHSLRDPNGWLYHGLYFGTRVPPYSGPDQLNAIVDIDTDPTMATFLDYFDPIRYAPTQHAPLLTVDGTHDEYFPLPNANLMEQAISSAGAQPDFEKRLLMLPNATHGLSSTSSSASATEIANIVSPLLQWFKYCFGGRDRPLATPTVSMADTGNGLRFEVALSETAARLASAQVTLYIASKVDSTVLQATPPTAIQDFRAYPAALQNGTYVVQLVPGQTSSSGDVLTAGNAIYYATATDDPDPTRGLPVSSLVYQGSLPIDLSTDFVPVIDQYPGDSRVAPPPPTYTPAATTLASSVPAGSDSDYQGMSLTNPSAKDMVVRVDGRTAVGRIGAAEGLINPIFMTLPAYSQRIFVAEEWFGPGARKFNGSFRMAWSDAHATSLAFRGKGAPSQLDAIGPLNLSPAPLWVALAPDLSGSRTLRVFAASGLGPADVKVTLYDSSGTPSQPQTMTVPASGTGDLPLTMPFFASTAAYARIDSSASLAARLEVMGAGDPYSLEALSVPSAASTLVQPHVELNGIFTTRFFALNTLSSSQNIAFILHQGSTSAPPVTRNLPAGALLDETAESLFSVAPGTPAGSGWVEVQPGGGGILLWVLAVDPKGGAAAANAIGPALSGSFSMPFFVQGVGYWTGLAVANPGNVQSAITITAYDETGKSNWSVTPAPLQPGTSATLLLSQWMPALPGDMQGQLIITSSAPVSLLAYFGTGDGLALAAIPFTPIAP